MPDASEVERERCGHPTPDCVRGSDKRVRVARGGDPGGGCVVRSIQAESVESLEPVVDPRSNGLPAPDCVRGSDASRLRLAPLEWAALATGLVLLIQYAWFMDDAFVYFRYVDNLLFPAVWPGL